MQTLAIRAFAAGERVECGWEACRPTRHPGLGYVAVQVGRSVMRRELPFYRSNTVRWALVITGAFLTYHLSPWAPPAWHRTPSLIWLHHLVPWPVLSAGFLLYTLLLWWGTVAATVVAQYLGLFMYLCELIALLATATGKAFNPWVVIAFALVCVLHQSAGRLAVHQRESG